MNQIDLFEGRRVVPLANFHSVKEVAPTLEKLLAGGIDIIEITFRTEAAIEAIKEAAQNFPVLVGAGTVLTAAQAEEALKAGAKFLVSPGLSLPVAKVAQEADIPYLPGCVTPTEIMAALALGLRRLKFFPASVYGGAAALKALAGPFANGACTCISAGASAGAGAVTFLPTGGVNFANIKDYLALPNVFAVGGSFVLEGDIAENCKKLKEVLA